MQVKQAVFTAAFLFFFVIPVFGQGGSSQNIPHNIILNYPPDKTVMEFGLVSISLTVAKDSTDTIKVKINNRDEREIIPDSSIECFSLPLAVGINRITMTAFRRGKPEEELALSVFRRSELIGKYKNPPEGFQKHYFHMQPNPECVDCHTLEPSDRDLKPINIAGGASRILSDIQTTAAASSTCYSCHKEIINNSYVHGPASVWSCLSCHDPRDEMIYSVKKPDTDICFKCHVEKKEEWFSKKYIHGPVNILKCAICHSPHASENPFNLFMPTWELCVSCHEANATSRHIVVGYIFRGHPTRGKPDPLRKGKELSCTSCHNPHASEYPKLWALKAQSPFELCQKCHQQYYKQFIDRKEK
jgi:predicted CXXCH cytochrome family protein